MNDTIFLISKISIGVATLSSIVGIAVVVFGFLLHQKRVDSQIRAEEQRAEMALRSVQQFGAAYKSIAEEVEELIQRDDINSEVKEKIRSIIKELNSKALEAAKEVEH